MDLTFKTASLQAAMAMGQSVYQQQAGPQKEDRAHQDSSENVGSQHEHRPPVVDADFTDASP